MNYTRKKDDLPTDNMTKLKAEFIKGKMSYSLVAQLLIVIELGFKDRWWKLG